MRAAKDNTALKTPKYNRFRLAVKRKAAEPIPKPGAQIESITGPLGNCADCGFHTKTCKCWA